MVRIRSNTVNRKQLYLATISRCINEFRQYIEVLKKGGDGETIYKYVDLINEELFYFKHDYIPREVAYEWIDGMIDFVPLVNEKGEILNPGNCIPMLLLKRDIYFKDFPRLKKAFVLSQKYNLEAAYSIDLSQQEQRASIRRCIAAEIFQNVKSFNYF